jgi:hypothetical protein
MMSDTDRTCDRKVERRRIARSEERARECLLNANPLRCDRASSTGHCSTWRAVLISGAMGRRALQTHRCTGGMDGLLVRIPRRRL